jgi:hypothetical protein
MTFNQANWNVEGDVYNTAGDLILSRNGSPEDLRVALRRIRADLAGLDEIDPQTRADLSEELERAETDALAPAAKRDGLVQRLRAVKERLESLDGATAAALGLAKTLGAVAVGVAALT